MRTHGRRYADARAKVDRLREYQPAEAVALVRSLSSAKFDETVEIHVRTGLNVRHADEQLRGTIALPNGLGKDVKIIVFAQGEKVREAEQAGADVVGGEDLAKRIEDGFDDFDVAIATPDMMGQVGRLGRKLGPRGLMPNPKTGTVTTEVGKAVVDFKGGRVEYRADTRSRGVVQVPIGKVSFEPTALLQNFRAVVEEVQRAKPAAAKGRYIKSVAVSSTMGPGVDIDPNTLRVTDEDLATV